MKYLHIKNLDKYNPGYKDRELVWCKTYFTMINADPEFELMLEIDKWRFVCFVMLEIQIKDFVILDESYLLRKGFDFKQRSLSLTLETLQNFIEIVTEKEKTCYAKDQKYVVQRRLEKIREEKKKICTETFVTENHFETFWKKLPQKMKAGKHMARRRFFASVKSDADLHNLYMAISNYRDCAKFKAGFVQNASTWMGNWDDWIRVERDPTDNLSSQSKKTVAAMKGFLERGQDEPKRIGGRAGEVIDGF